MSPKEAVLLIYGFIFGASTPYLKPKNRFLFPTAFVKVDEHFEVLLGGSGICAVLRSVSDQLVVNCNQAAAAEEWKRSLNRTPQKPVKAVILNSLNGNFGNSKTLARFSGSKFYIHARLNEDLEAFADSNLPVTNVLHKTTLPFSDETVHLIPVFETGSGSDLVVFFEKRSVMMFGALFYNRIHPELRTGDTARVEKWIDALEGILQTYQPDVCVPGEGQIGTANDVREFIAYLSALRDPSIEFSDCRKRFDWTEIPSSTSLEENFDTLRRNVKTHTSIN